MEINVIAFGQIAEIVAKSAFKIAGIENTDQLKAQLRSQFPALENINYSIAINKKVIHSNVTLKNEDTVALLPPFSGG